MSAPHKSAKRMRRQQGGFSLMETMVGISLGLIATLVITQTISLFYGGRNSIVGNAGAQENGLFAMQLISSELRSAGAGAYASSAQGSSSLYACTNVCSYYGTGSGSGSCSNEGNPTGGTPIASLSGQSFTGSSYTLKLPLFPIIIEGAAAGTSTVRYASNSDIVTIRSITRLNGAIPALLSAQINNIAANPTPLLGVNRSFGFKSNDSQGPGDLALIADSNNSSNCLIFEITSVNSDGPSLARQSGNSNFNPSTFLWPSKNGQNQGNQYSVNSPIYVLSSASTGKTGFTAKEFSIAGPSGTLLQLREIGAADPNSSTSSTGVLTLADGIVAFKAQYGIATSSGDSSGADCGQRAAVQTWIGPDDSSGNWNSYWAPGALDSNHARCIRAVRFVVAARSGSREAGVVTNACSSRDYSNGPCPSGTSSQADTSMPAINLATLPWASNGEWQHYRYKIYSTVVPIRNLLWNGAWNYQNGVYSGQ